MFSIICLAPPKNRVCITVTMLGRTAICDGLNNEQSLVKKQLNDRERRLTT